MQFLTPEQILHDVAAFIETIHIQHHSESRVILWGSGYGATLATWARKKYPHLIDGTWSSSGVFEIDLASLSNEQPFSKYLEDRVNKLNGLQMYTTALATFSIAPVTLNVVTQCNRHFMSWTLWYWLAMLKPFRNV